MRIKTIMGQDAIYVAHTDFTQPGQLSRYSD